MQGNFVGTDVAGRLGDGIAGVLISAAPTNTIGGAPANVIGINPSAASVLRRLGTASGTWSKAT